MHHTCGSHEKINPIFTTSQNNNICAAPVITTRTTLPPDFLAVPYPQLTLTEDLASAALSAWKVPPPDHHIAGFVTCFSSKRTFSEMPFLTPLLKQQPVWLCLRLLVLISSQQSLPSSFHDSLYLHGLMSHSPAPRTKMYIPRQQETRLSSPPR